MEIKRRSLPKKKKKVFIDEVLKKITQENP